LWIEWVLLFIVAPVGIGLTLRSAPWLLLLGGTAVVVAVWLVCCGNFSLRHFWLGDSAEAERRQLREVLLRFSVCAAGLIALTSGLYPEKLFEFPRATPLRWAALLVIYPAVSVYPQELLYRAFFVRRYQSLFPRVNVSLLISALVFSWMHLIFRNHLAVILTLVGGWFFAETYARTHSLRLVCLEHALYGNLIFTIGLGEYFCAAATLSR
jgi:membrane protease YdiL (CAAX protease family)